MTYGIYNLFEQSFFLYNLGGTMAHILRNAYIVLILYINIYSLDEQRDKVQEMFNAHNISCLPTRHKLPEIHVQCALLVILIIIIINLYNTMFNIIDMYILYISYRYSMPPPPKNPHTPHSGLIAPEKYNSPFYCMGTAQVNHTKYTITYITCDP